MDSFTPSTLLVYASALFVVHLSVGYSVYHFFWKKRKHRGDNDGSIGMMLGFFAGTWILLYFLGVAAFVLAGSFGVPKEHGSITSACQEQIAKLQQQQKDALNAYRNLEDKNSQEARQAAQQYVDLGLESAQTIENATCQ